jgi:8-oxo-dGTP pyrophosphatase MutT (NUDIX family)
MAIPASKDVTLWSNEWLSIRLKDGWYTYMHEQRTDGRLVVVLGYRINPLDPEAEPDLVGRVEKCPPHRDGFALCALTGGVEIGESPLEAAVKEFHEEAGIRVGPREMINLGTTRPIKAADTTAYLYAVNVRDRQIGKSIGDGTRGEEGAYCKWISWEEAFLSKDPLLAALAARLAMRLFKTGAHEGEGKKKTRHRARVPRGSRNPPAGSRVV